MLLYPVLSLSLPTRYKLIQSTLKNTFSYTHYCNLFNYFQFRNVSLIHRRMPRRNMTAQFVGNPKNAETTHVYNPPEIPVKAMILLFHLISPGILYTLSDSLVLFLFYRIFYSFHIYRGKQAFGDVPHEAKSSIMSSDMICEHSKNLATTNWPRKYNLG